MTKVDIFSGFLGAGKTTLIKKLISEAYCGQKIVLIENEFGEIGIDGGFMEDAGIQVNELNSGCICCSLVGDFTVALAKVIEEYAPDRILIEPSGVGKLSDIIKAVSAVDGLSIASATVVCDGARCKMYMKNFGEFYNDQVSNAAAIVLSRTQNLSDDKISAAVELLREKNPDAVIITTPWDKLSGEQILEAIEGCDTLDKQLEEMEHHHHHHEQECHDPDCDCHQHHHHHADEVFASWGMETAAKFSEEGIRSILAQLENAEEYGVILRAKGIVDSTDGQWIHFDYVPGDADIRRGGAGIIGRFCVIGSGINESALKQLFKV